MFKLCLLVLLACAPGSYSAPASRASRSLNDRSRNMIKKLSTEPEEILDNSTELRFKTLAAAVFKKNNELLKDLTSEDYYDEYDEANFNPIINIRFKRAENIENVDADNSTEQLSEEENSEAEDNNTMKMASKAKKNTAAGNKRPRSNKTNVLKRTRKVKSNRSLRKSNRRRNRRRRLRKNRS